MEYGLFNRMLNLFMSIFFCVNRQPYATQVGSLAVLSDVFVVYTQCFIVYNYYLLRNNSSSSRIR